MNLKCRPGFYYTECGPWTLGINLNLRVCKRYKILALMPVQMNLNLHLNKILYWFKWTLKFEKYWVRSVTFKLIFPWLMVRNNFILQYSMCIYAHIHTYTHTYVWNKSLWNNIYTQYDTVLIFSIPSSKRLEVTNKMISYTLIDHQPSVLKTHLNKVFHPWHYWHLNQVILHHGLLGCVEGCWVASLASTYWMPVATSPQL